MQILKGASILRIAERNEYISRAFAHRRLQPNNGCFGSISVLGAQEHKKGADDELQITSLLFGSDGLSKTAGGSALGCNPLISRHETLSQDCARLPAQDLT